MNMRKKRLLSIGIVLLMLLTSLPLAALAAPPDDTQELKLVVWPALTKAEGEAGNGHPILDAQGNPSLPEGAEALQGGYLKLEYVEPMDDKEGSQDPDDYEAVSSFTPIIKAIDGNAVEFESAANSTMVRGYYRVTEWENETTTTPGSRIKPFVLRMPLQNPLYAPDDNTSNEPEWLYEVHAYPKQIEGPEVEKKVLKEYPEGDVTEEQEGRDEGTSQANAVGNKIPWQISAEVREDFEEEFVMFDTLDTRLTFIESSLKVFGLNREGDSVAFTKDTHYTVALDAAANKFTITFTDDNRVKVCLDGTGDDMPKIIAIFQTYANGTGNPGKIANTAELEYTNTGGGTGKGSSDPGTQDPPGTTPPGPGVVEIFEIRLTKTDDSEPAEYLAGARFKLYTDEACTQPVMRRNADGTEVELEEESADNTGLVTFNGLAPGDYWLVETVAPAGKAKPLAPIQITLAGADLTDYIYRDTMVNHDEPRLPPTGQVTALLFTAAGLLLIVIGLFANFQKRKKQGMK